MCMRLSGVEFHPSRAKLHVADLDALLGSAVSVDAALMTGRTLRENRLTNIRRITRAILPHPRSASVAMYCRADPAGDLARNEADVCQATHFFRKQQIAVRWFPETIFQTFLVGDGRKNSGWVHLETGLPYSRTNLRTSWKASRSKHEELVDSIADIFDAMWKDSAEPDAEILKLHPPMEESQ